MESFQNASSSSASLEDASEASKSGLMPLGMLNAASMSLAFRSNCAISRKLSFRPVTALPKRSPLVSSLRPARVKASATPRTIQSDAIKPAGSSKPVSAPAEASGTPPVQSKAGDFQSVSVFPDFHRLRNDGDHPSKSGAFRKAVIVWFRNDLRIHDNEALAAANREALSVLPIFCFDPREFCKSSSGFGKTGAFEANFLLQCVANLRENLREKGSDLVIRIGKREEVLVELSKEVGADALYLHHEVSRQEIATEQKVFSALDDEGVETKFFWGSTLYHIDDLPFKLDDMPSTYGGFCDKIQKLKVRGLINSPRRLKGLPTRGSVDRGEIPSLLDLGLSPQVVQNGKTNANAIVVGGESEALEKLKTFAAEYRKQPMRHANGGSGSNPSDSLYGANFSSKISPWLTTGCLSPRFVLEELKKGESISILSSLRTHSAHVSNDCSLNWLLCELQWRDFFKFITKKYNSAKFGANTVPATACSAAIAP